MAMEMADGDDPSTSVRAPDVFTQPPPLTVIPAAPDPATVYAAPDPATAYEEPR